MDKFLDKYKKELEDFQRSDLYHEDDDPHHYATFAYDAVWTMALAMQATDNQLKSVPLLIQHSFMGQLSYN